MRLGAILLSAMLGCMFLMLAAGCSTGGEGDSTATFKVIGFDKVLAKDI